MKTAPLGISSGLGEHRPELTTMIVGGQRSLT